MCAVFKETKIVLDKPLKFGLIRASYPDVRPMSESRKSDGDMLEDLGSCSLASTTLERKHGNKNHLIRKKTRLRNQEVNLICRLAAA